MKPPFHDYPRSRFPSIEQNAAEGENRQGYPGNPPSVIKLQRGPPTCSETKSRHPLAGAAAKTLPFFSATVVASLGNAPDC
jgi:hypothetical protein